MNLNQVNNNPPVTFTPGQAVAKPDAKTDEENPIFAQDTFTSKPVFDFSVKAPAPPECKSDAGRAYLCIFFIMSNYSCHVKRKLSIIGSQFPM